MKTCKHNRLSLNKRYLRYSGTFDFRTDLKTNLLSYHISLNKVKMPNTEINKELVEDRKLDCVSCRQNVWNN